MSARKCCFAAKRSFKDGCVKLQYEGNASGYGAAIAVKLSDDIQSGHARHLAAELTRLADEAEAKVAKDAAAKARRAAWVDREVAAGRMHRLSAAQFFRRAAAQPEGEGE